MANLTIFQKNSTLHPKYAMENLISENNKIKAIHDVIKKTIAFDAPVLFLGERGTEKEQLAKTIHFNSPRADKPFVHIKCDLCDQDELERDFFACSCQKKTEKETKKAILEIADGGTIFLDEVHTLSPSMQARLLAIMNEAALSVEGCNHKVSTDIRIMSSTTTSLAEEVKNGNFNYELFFNLGVIILDIPPLRERKEDMSLLITHLIKEINQKYKTNVVAINPLILKRLMDYNWPGNIKELETAMERAIILTEGDTIVKEDIFRLCGLCEASPTEIDDEELSIKKRSRILETQLIQKAIVRTKGNKTQAAQILEISLPALLYKIKNYNIQFLGSHRGKPSDDLLDAEDE